MMTEGINAWVHSFCDSWVTLYEMKNVKKDELIILC